ncbi:MAG: glycosyltransferase family 1 protein [Desulfobacteraceae bacterium]|nr:glycosyltransferase family 1 protein [Desulfobacteraceae bacterium]
MNILLNATPLTGLLTGISRYVRNLYTHLDGYPDITVDYFDGRRTYRRMPDQAEPGRWIRDTGNIWRLPDAAVFGLRSFFWLMYEFRVRRRLERRYDIYHETAFTPARIFHATPQIFTLHDLSLMHFRQHHPRERVWFSDFFFNKRIREADHIIVPSEFILQEAIEYIKIKQNQITVIPEAPDPFFYPRPGEDVSVVLKRLGIPAEYLLFAGTLEPRKNLSLVIEALHRCGLDVPLVLCGWSGWGEKSWMRKIEAYGLKKRIHQTGYVDETTLACLYSGARALVYPSLYEGFGLPVLEAMACGCPVMCANTASLPEVAGDAALFFDPHQPEQLAHLIKAIYSDDALSESLTQKGYGRAARFTWRQAAEKTREVFCRMIKK